MSLDRARLVILIVMIAVAVALLLRPPGGAGRADRQRRFDAMDADVAAAKNAAARAAQSAAEAQAAARAAQNATPGSS
jgi:hypothetical protein